jgi:hypothetical protein
MENILFLTNNRRIRKARAKAHLKGKAAPMARFYRAKYRKILKHNRTLIQRYEVMRQVIAKRERYLDEAMNSGDGTYKP